MMRMLILAGEQCDYISNLWRVTNQTDRSWISMMEVRFWSGSGLYVQLQLVILRRPGGGVTPGLVLEQVLSDRWTSCPTSRTSERPRCLTRQTLWVNKQETFWGAAAAGETHLNVLIGRRDRTRCLDRDLRTSAACVKNRRYRTWTRSFMCWKLKEVSQCYRWSQVSVLTFTGMNEAPPPTLRPGSM